jgi:hypothetical protein
VSDHFFLILKEVIAKIANSIYNFIENLLTLIKKSFFHFINLLIVSLYFNYLLKVPKFEFAIANFKCGFKRILNNSLQFVKSTALINPNNLSTYTSFLRLYFVHICNIY